PSLTRHPKNAFSLMIAPSISKARDASVFPSFTISLQTNCEPTCEIFRLRYSFRVVTRHVSAGSFQENAWLQSPFRPVLLTAVPAILAQSFFSAHPVTLPNAK